LTLWPATVELEGASIPLADVISDVVIHHGRESIESQAEAATCQLTFYGVDNSFVGGFEVGQSLRVDIAGVDETVTNGDFSDGIGAVELHRCTGVLDASYESEAAPSLKITRTVATPHCGVTAAPFPLALQAGRPYLGRAKVRAPVGKTLFTYADYYSDAAGEVWIGGSQLDWTADGSWQTIEHAFTPDAGTITGDWGVYLNAGPIGDIFNVDDLSVSVKVPRFTGRITDARLDGDDLTVIAAGPWSVYRTFVVGEIAWPVEAWSARVTRIFAEAGIPELLELHSDPNLDPDLAARDPETAGPTTLGDYLGFLAPMVGALVADRPNGSIVVQAIGARRLADAVALDPADVAYAPVWVEQLPGGNIVTVRYTGDQSEQVTATDDASRALYGDRPETIDTAFVDPAAATSRASTRLGRAAFSHWEMPQAPILRGLDLQLGDPIILEGLPDPAPFEPWTPILEGWTDTITGPDWTMDLALSDPLTSGIALPWASIPRTAEYHWNTLDPSTDWTEALTLEALNAS
jgi:hypothetical protein